MVVSPAPNRPARGIVRLLNTAGGRVLCLAGEVDATSVEDFVRRYGREPMPVDAIDAGSVTRLSMPALDLLLAAAQVPQNVRYGPKSSGAGAA